jgi:hypothetical protein
VVVILATEMVSSFVEIVDQRTDRSVGDDGMPHLPLLLWRNACAMSVPLQETGTARIYRWTLYGHW